MKFIINFIKKFIYILFPNLKSNGNNYYKEYVKKNYMTNNEIVFYRKLIELEKLYNYKIIPQVNLASIIIKNSNSRYRSELFRNIDFGIFDNNFNLLLLIELNDSTHNIRRRIYRDNKVKDICQQASIKIITFYTKYDNNLDYVIDRILKIIHEKD